MQSLASDTPRERDEIELLRAGAYGLISSLLRQAPDRVMLERLSTIKGGATPLGRAHAALAEAAATSNPEALQREFFDLFVGLGRGELLPYASYYLTGFLNERPLAQIRRDLALIGLEAVENLQEPEDHIAILCEVMAGLAGGQFAADAGAERGFFERNMMPWAQRFFSDLERTRSARFYRALGTLGRLFMATEAEAFAMAGKPNNPGSNAAQPPRSSSIPDTRRPVHAGSQEGVEDETRD